MAAAAKNFGSMKRLSSRTMSSCFSSSLCSSFCSLNTTSLQPVVFYSSHQELVRSPRSPTSARSHHTTAYYDGSSRGLTSAYERRLKGSVSNPNRLYVKWSWGAVNGARHRHVSPNKYKSMSDRTPMPLEIERAQIITKVTRYQDEASRICGKRWADITQPELDFVDKTLDEEGFSSALVKKSHKVQMDSLNKITTTLTDFGIEYTILTSGESFTSSLDDPDDPSSSSRTNSARRQELLNGKKYDILISAGGDGTFLRAALENKSALPQIGINTDPTRSRGKLCAMDASSFGVALQRLKEGKFRWLKRNRLTVRLSKANTLGSSSEDLHTIENLALNEVFVGEKDPCRTSILRVRADDDAFESYKCSGILISTGTGTTAWSSEASKINPQDVIMVLRGIERVYSQIKLDNIFSNGFDAGAVSSAANEAASHDLLPPDSEEIQMLVREPIINPGQNEKGLCIWQGQSPSKATLVGDGQENIDYSSLRSICKRVTVHSAGKNTKLVLDGRIHVPLERGWEAEIFVDPKKALWSFAFD